MPVVQQLIWYAAKDGRAVPKLSMVAFYTNKVVMLSSAGLFECSTAWYMAREKAYT